MLRQIDMYGFENANLILPVETDMFLNSIVAFDLHSIHSYIGTYWFGIYGI